MAKTLLDLAASGPKAQGLSERLRSDIEDVLTKYLRKERSEWIGWTFYVLDARSRTLVPVLSSNDGEVQRSFAVGTGIVGHAARMKDRTAWHIDEQGRNHPAFVPGMRVEPRWIVALPFSIQGRAVATLGLAGTEPASNSAEEVLESIALGKNDGLVNELWTHLEGVLMRRLGVDAGEQDVAESHIDALSGEQEAEMPVVTVDNVDVFLSFVRADRRRANRIAERFAQMDLVVWRSGRPPAREELDDDTMTLAMRAARLVVELVSSRSREAFPEESGALVRHDPDRFVLLLDQPGEDSEPVVGARFARAWTRPLLTRAVDRIRALLYRQNWEYFLIDLTSSGTQAEHLHRELTKDGDRRGYVERYLPEEAPTSVDTGLARSAMVVVVVSPRTEAEWLERRDVSVALDQFCSGTSHLVVVHHESEVMASVVSQHLYFVPSIVLRDGDAQSAASELRRLAADPPAAPQLRFRDGVTSIEAVARLLGSLFEKHDLVRWLEADRQTLPLVADLPDPASAAEVAQETSRLLHQRGIVPQALDRLSQVRPNRLRDIIAVRRLLG